MIRWAVVLMLAPVAACHDRSASAPLVSVQLQRDTIDYAMASCVASQPQPFLKDQGERWANAVIQRGHGAIEHWSRIADAVEIELKRSGIAQGQGDGSQAETVPLPVMTCGEITDRPRVQAAIAIARRTLSSDYATPTP